MEVKFAEAAANFTNFNIKIGASVAGARNGGEICGGGSKFHRLLHASESLLKLRLSDKVQWYLEPHSGSTLSEDWVILGKPCPGSHQDNVPNVRFNTSHTKST